MEMRRKGKGVVGIYWLPFFSINVEVVSTAICIIIGRRMC